MPAADPANPLGPIGSAVQRWLTDTYHTAYHLVQDATTAPLPTQMSPPVAEALAPIVIAVPVSLGALELGLGIVLARRRRVRGLSPGTT